MLEGGQTFADGRTGHLDESTSRIESYGRFVGKDPRDVGDPSEARTLRVGPWPRTPSTLGPGTRVGAYAIEAQIGRGSFGDVYRARARDGHLAPRQVAIKVLSEGASLSPDVVSRFMDEAVAARAVVHPNVVRIFESGRLGPSRRPYHVMELLAGTSLDHRLRAGGPLPLEEALVVLRGIASALDAAHAAGVLHRDLKPSNVFLAQGVDGRVVPKLIDFGVAKLFGRRSPHVTEIGMLVGTPEYMSPEQCGGERVDRRSDVYGFGVLAYEVLVGAVPFRGRNPFETLRRQIAEPPVLPSVQNPLVPSSVDDLVLWMLEKRPERRPSSLVPVISALEAIADEEETLAAFT